MRSFVAYVLALLATSAGIWFGFYADADVEGEEARRPALANPVILALVVDAPFSDKLAALGTAVANESVTLTANRSDLVQAVHFDEPVASVNWPSPQTLHDVVPPVEEYFPASHG